MKAPYDADVLEEYLVKWYQDGLTGGNKSSLIWKNVTPFIEWLQSAESEFGPALVFVSHYLQHVCVIICYVG